MRINIHVLKAVNLVASKEQARPYLNGVLVETDFEGIRLTATDGHRIITSIQNWNPGDENFGIAEIIPSTLLDKIKLNKKEKYAELIITNGKAHIDYNNVSYTEKLLDGPYPPYKRVFPKTCSKEHAHFNLEYLASFAKAARMAVQDKSVYPYIHYNGRSEPSLIDLSKDNEDFKMVGAIMPMRDVYTFGDISFSNWVHKEETIKKEIAA